MVSSSRIKESKSLRGDFTILVLPEIGDDWTYWTPSSPRTVCQEERSVGLIRKRKSANMAKHFSFPYLIFFILFSFQIARETKPLQHNCVHAFAINIVQMPREKDSRPMNGFYVMNKNTFIFA